jgi:pimeloyl-ACP methyl ester carboxylesterase
MTETLVLIPGLLCDATVWVPIAERLGRGEVADIAHQTTIEEMAADTLASFPGQLAVAGHSMGARVAMEMWRQAPQRIGRLALMDTGLDPATEAEKPNRFRRVALAHEKSMAALCDDWLPPMVWDGRHDDLSVMAPLRAMVIAKSPAMHERQIHALLARPDARPVLPTITVPTLVLVGAEDRWSPVAQHEDIASLVPGARMVVVPEAGHFAPFERPDAVAAAMNDWLEG